MSEFEKGSDLAGRADLHAGQILFDEYLVERQLGEGGYGAVYLVRSNLTGEQFAVKRAIVEDSEGRRDLLNELRAWMNLPHHPHIVTCRFFKISGSAIYIFADYVDGGSLADSQRTLRLYEGDPDEVLARILKIAVQSAWGLHAAHQVGLVHQDVKPSNILLTSNWTAKVADFGLTEKRQPDSQCEAILDYILQDIPEDERKEHVRGTLREQLNTPSAQGVRGRGTFTLSYASPDQLAGAELTPATDLWSWGVTLLEMFSGRCTWQTGAEAPGALSEIALNGPTLDGPPRLPQRVAAVIDRCLRIDTGERWPSLSEASAEVVLAYDEILQRGFPGSPPAAAELPKTTFTRKLPFGSGWRDPRPWVDLAYSLEGKTKAEAVLHYPDPTGSVTSRAVSDLESFEHALQILERLYSSGRRDIARELGLLHGHLGHVCAFLGDVEAALKHLDICAGLIAANSGPEDRVALATSWNSKAILLRKAARATESINVCNRALDFWRDVSEQHPPEERDQILAMLLNTKANAVTNASEALQLHSECLSLPGLDSASKAKYLASQANDFGRLQDWDQYGRAAKEAREMLDRLIREEHRTDLKGALAILLMNSGHVEAQRRRFPEAVALMDQCIGILLPLVAEEGQWELAEHIGTSYFEKAKTLEALGQSLQALDAYAAAREHLSEIVLRGGRSDLTVTLSETLRNEANLNRALGREAEALRLSANAVELFRRLQQRGKGTQYVPFLARAWSVYSASLLEDDRVTEAVKVSEEAVNLFRSLPEDDPCRKSADFANALMSLGVAARRAGDPQTTWNSYQEALSILERFDDGNALSLKALILYNSGNLLGDAGNIAESLDQLDQAIAIWTALAERFGAGFNRDDLVMAHKARANQLLKIGDYEAALGASDETVPLLTRMVEEGRDDLREDLGKLWAGRALILKKLGDLERSIAAFAQSASIFKTASARHRQPEFVGFADYALKESEQLKALATFREQDAEKWCVQADEAIQSGTQMSRNGDPFHGCELMDDAILIYSVMLRHRPNRSWVQSLARAQMSKALMAMYSHRDCAAERAFRAAMEGFDQLIREFRRADEVENWGKSSLGLAVFLKSVGRAQESEAVIDAAKQRMGSLGGEQFKRWQTLADQMLHSA